MQGRKRQQMATSAKVWQDGKRRPAGLMLTKGFSGTPISILCHDDDIYTSESPRTFFVQSDFTNLAVGFCFCFCFSVYMFLAQAELTLLLSITCGNSIFHNTLPI